MKLTLLKIRKDMEDKKLKAGDYAVAHTGIFFYEASYKEAEIIAEGEFPCEEIEGKLYSFVSEKKAKSILEWIKNPLQRAESLSLENEKLQKEVESLRKKTEGGEEKTKK